MTRHIMLSFMSPYKDSARPVEVSSYYGPQGFNAQGIQTNEPALLYILSLHQLEKYYFFCSKKVQESLRYNEDGNLRTEKMSHADCFSSRMGERYSGFPLIMEPLLYDEGGFDAGGSDLLSVQVMAKTVKEYALPLISAGEEVVMHVDMTGGFRHASMLMLAVVGLLKYSGIKIGKVLYTNYDFEKKKGKIEEVTETHNIMQLIAGAEAFVTYGSVDVLKKYFGKKAVSAELKTLLLEMENFSDSLKLCRTGVIESNIARLGEAIEKYDGARISSLEEKLFKELLERIKLEYASLIGEHSKLDVISWCLSKGFLQQALTFYTEWVPGIIVSSGIISPGSDVVRKECIKQAPDYVAWEKHLLASYNSSSASASFGVDSCLGNLRRFFETSDSSYKDKVVRMLQPEGIDAGRIFDELALNDRVAADLKSRVITVKEIKDRYPSLFYAIDRIYYGSAKDTPKSSFETYWCSALSQASLYKRMSCFKKEWLKRLFCMESIEIHEDSPDALCPADKPQINALLARKNILKSLFDRALIKSNVPGKLALDIASEYNAIRIIRNNCNHANEGSEIPPVDKIKDMLAEYIERIRSAMEEADDERI